MRVRRLIALLALVFIWPVVSLRAGDAGPLQLHTYRQADEATRGLIRKVIEGIGGADRLAHLSAIQKSCAIEQELPKPVHVDFEGVVQFPDTLLAIIKLPSKRLTAVRTADSAFVYRSNSPISGAALKLNEAERRTFAGFFFSHPLVVLQNQIHSQYRFAVAGEGAVNGRRVDVLAISAEGYELRWYVDRENGRVVRTQFEDRITDFDDWRNVEGLVLPFRETVTRNGAAESSTTVKSFKVNPQIDQAVLNPPKFWEERYNLPARDEFKRTYTTYYYFYWLYY